MASSVTWAESLKLSEPFSSPQDKGGNSFPTDLCED